jgi:5-methylcytosine-specific restriction enzyme subunit McrC
LRRLSLRQHRPEPGVPLTNHQRDALRQLVPDLAISEMPELDGVYELTAGAKVGSVVAADLAVEIRPKIPMERLLFILSYSLDPIRWLDYQFDFSESDSLVEAVIPGFVAQIRRAFAPGLLQGYRVEEAALTTVKGRIRFEDQVKRRYGILPPIEVRFDEFTEDILENRLIKSALTRLRSMRIRSERARRSLHRFDGVLANVADFEMAGEVPSVEYTRLNERYRPAVELARLIVESSSLEAGRGRVQGVSFLVDMNKAFEDFVVVALRETLRVSAREFSQGARGRRLPLDQRKQVRLKPDLSWWKDGRCIFVGDVKYKRTNAEGIDHPDLYQLLAYTIGTDLRGGLLVYAAGEGDPIIHETINVGKRLEVTTINLSGSIESIFFSMERLADRIRDLGARAEGLG